MFGRKEEVVVASLGAFLSFVSFFPLKDISAALPVWEQGGRSAGTGSNAPEVPKPH